MWGEEWAEGGNRQLGLERWSVGVMEQSLPVPRNAIAGPVLAEVPDC